MRPDLPSHLARGRAARKVPRRTNSRTPPRPRRCATLGPSPQDACRSLKSGVACAIFPGNPSLCRSRHPSSPPAPPRMSSARHRSARSAEPENRLKISQFGTLSVRQGMHSDPPAGEGQLSRVSADAAAHSQYRLYLRYSTYSCRIQYTIVPP